jgi:phosphoribosylanthranilate isomerase
MLVKAGVDAVGIPLGPPPVKAEIPLETASAISAVLPPRVAVICITYAEAAEEIIPLCRAMNATAVQLHGDAPTAISTATMTILRQRAPELFIIKSLVVRQGNLEELEAELAQCAPHADAFLTDTFDPATGERGATGMTHDWEISSRLVRMSPKPIILAGGLSPDNVREAIARVAPAGVDAHTGLESADGRKDPEQVARFVAEARAGFDDLPAAY